MSSFNKSLVRLHFENTALKVHELGCIRLIEIINSSEKIHEIAFFSDI